MDYTIYNLTGSALFARTTSFPALSFQDMFTPSFQDMLTSSMVDILVYPRACHIVGAQQNCTTSCSDASVMFGSLETFHNCLIYPAVANLSVSGSLNDAHLADSLGIDTGSQVAQVAQTINATIYECLHDYCGNDDDCETALQGNYGLYYANGSYPSISELDICGYISPFSFLNADIGGLGVYVSYWIQSGLALLGTILILLWSSGTCYICFPILAIRDGNKAKEVAHKLAAAWKLKRLPALAAATTDFQKAQCFFMMAINVAALVNKHQGGLDPNNLQQLYNNYVLIKCIAVSGYLPVTLTLLGLHKVGMVSWYLLILSVLTVGLSIGTLVDLGSFSPSRSDLNAIASVAHGNQGLDECGGNNLTVYCLQTINQNESGEYDPSNGAYVILGLCIVVLVFLVADQSHAFMNPSTKETKPWLLKVYEICVVDSVSLRGFEFSLAIIACLTSWPRDFLDFSFLLYYMIFYLVYIFGISHLKALGKLKNDWFLFAADFVTAVLWLLYSLPSLKIIGLVVWILFTASTVRSWTQLRAHSRKIREWSFAFQHRIFERSSSNTPPRPSETFRHTTWINPVSIMKTALILVVLARRHMDKWKTKATIQDWAGKGRKFVVFTMYLTFAAFYIYGFAIFFRDLAWFGPLVDKHSWGFGQIVAITVWASPLCEFFHLEMRGMKRGFQHRLIWPYRVIMGADNTGSGHRVSSSSAVPQAPTVESPKGEHNDESLEEISITQTEGASGGEIAS